MPNGEAALIQIVDAVLAEAARRSGAWIACRPGCTECCMGPFEISAHDAARLQRGLRELEPERAARVRQRARTYEGGDDEPCPALDPVTGLCELYAFRPMTCRTFGPAIRCGDEVGACELCYAGATDNEIAACAVELDTDELENRLLGDAGEPATVAAAMRNIDSDGANLLISS